MIKLSNAVMHATSIVPGRIMGFERDGRISVLPFGEESSIAAFFLRTSGGSFPMLEEGDLVLLMLGEDAQCYVLGAIEPYAQPATPDNGLQEPAAEETGDQGTLARDIEKVQLIGKKVYIEAEEEIRIKCGEGLIVIDQQGKVVTRGAKILSRAKGIHKIKGGAVAIN